MVRTFACLGAVAIVFLVLTPEARAKMVYYEINGQRYSYSTTNRREMQRARQLINAANAWDAAKAKAQAERSVNPLVAIFGSTAQREAREAEARVQQVLSRPRMGSRQVNRAKVHTRRASRRDEVASSAKVPSRRAQDAKVRVQAGRNREVAAPAGTSALGAHSKGARLKPSRETDRDRLWEEFLRWRSRQSQDRNDRRQADGPQ